MHLDIAARLEAQRTLAHLCALLAAGQLDDPPPYLSVVAVNGQWSVGLEIHRGPEQAAPEPVNRLPEIASPPATADLDERLTPLMRTILAALTPTLQSRNRLANLCDHDNDSHFGKCLRRLVQLGYALKVGFAYRLPDSCQR